MTRSTCRQVLGALILVVATGVARADTIQVKMEKLAFVPAEVTARVGDTIEWVNSALQSTLIPDASNAELKDLLTTGLKIFQGHEQHAEHVAAEFAP